MKIKQKRFGVFGDTASYEFDFFTKVAGSTIQCPLKLYQNSIDLASIPAPTDLSWKEVTDQKIIDRLKDLNEVPITSVNTSTKTAVWNGQTLVLQSDSQPAVRDDLSGKVSGSTMENPNRICYDNSGATVLKAPSQITLEHSSPGYSMMSSLNNIFATVSTYVVNGIAQQLISFSLIDIIERKYGLIPVERTGTASEILARQVTWLKSNISKLACNWYGHGSGPGGNKAYLSAYNFGLGSYTYTGTTTASSPTLAQSAPVGASIPNTIDANGFIHFLAYSDASNGTIPSTINTDYVFIDIQLKAAAGHDLLVPQSPRIDGGMGNVIILNQSTGTAISLFDNNSVDTEILTLNKAAAYLIELDLTSICNSIYGGSNSLMEAALKTVNIDVWAKGNGSNSGVLTNGCVLRWWSAGGSVYNGGNVNTNTTNNAASISKMTSLINTNANAAYYVGSNNKIYFVVYSQYASDTVIPSTLALDYINIKVEFTRSSDTISPIQISLDEEWSVVIKGASPSFNTPMSDKILINLYSNSNANNLLALKFISGNYLRLVKVIDGVNTGVNSNAITLSKFQVINAIVIKSKSILKVRYMFNNQSIYEIVLPNNAFIKDLFSLYVGLDKNNTGQADSFFESITILKKTLSDNEADAILKGRNDIIPTNSDLTALAKKFESPNVIPLFTDNRWAKHANSGIAISADGKTLYLTTTGSYQFHRIIIPVMPNNRYSLSYNKATANNYIDVIERYNDIELTSKIYIGKAAIGDVSTTFVTGSKTNYLRILLNNETASTFTFSNLELRRLD